MCVLVCSTCVCLHVLPTILMVVFPALCSTLFVVLPTIQYFHIIGVLISLQHFGLQQSDLFLLTVDDCLLKTINVVSTIPKCMTFLIFLTSQ